MTKQEHLDKFYDTVSILVKAYLNNTLEHGSCTACAVGNIVAHAQKWHILIAHDGTLFPEWKSKNGRFVSPYWDDVFISDGGDLSDDSYQSIYPTKYKGNAKKQIDATGYTWQELARIEKAFESITYSNFCGTDDEAMFAGLMKVVDVLVEIHGVDLSVSESAKLQFVKC